MPMNIVLLHLKNLGAYPGKVKLFTMLMATSRIIALKI